MKDKDRYCAKKNILLNIIEYSNCRDCQTQRRKVWNGSMCLTSSRIQNGSTDMEEMVKKCLRETKLKRILE